jgi:hypothetical protein
VLRELFLKSGNLCAFPDCSALMMERDGTFIGNVCHIEAAETAGPRFNPRQSNEDRRAFANLILLCYRHHKRTDNEKKYPVAKLREMKREHEQKFSDPGRAMLAQLKDWTTHDEPSFAESLKGANDELDWGLSDTELAQAVVDVKKFVSTLRNVPVASRKVLGLLAARAYRLKKALKPAQQRQFELLADDAQAALQLDKAEFKRHIDILDHHGFAAVDQNSDRQWIIGLYGIPRWNIWDDLAAFAEARGVSIDRFVIDLSFHLLDVQVT